VKIKTSNLVDKLIVVSASYSPRMTNYPERGVVRSSEPFTFW